MNAPAARVTTALLARRARALKRHLPDAVTGDVEALHHTRVASRRLREALPVLSTGLRHSKAGKADRKLRRLTRALGEVRELDVTLQLLDGLAHSPHVARGAVEEIRARVRTERLRRRAVMLRRLKSVDTAKLERRLASVADALERAEGDGWRDGLGARLLTRARSLTGAMNAAGQIYAAEQLHHVRIAAKKLRYALEIAVEVGVASASGPLAVIKRAQETLGRMHDLQVVQVHVAGVQAHPTEGRRTPQGLDAFDRRLEDECRRLHGRYVASTPALRDACAAVIATVAPNVERRRRPLKMALSRTSPRHAAGGAR